MPKTPKDPEIYLDETQTLFAQFSQLIAVNKLPLI